MKIKQKAWYLIITVLFSSVMMTLTDSVWSPGYFQKSLVKILLFLLFPLIYYAVNRNEFPAFKQLFVPKKKDFFLSLLLGVSVFAVILGGYFLLCDVVDFSGITESLTASAGVDKDNFVVVALYISFVNSLLEEFFFRGFAFLNLKKHTSRSFAYIFSALFFSLYHIGMTAGWFHIGLSSLTLVGLFVGGCIFNFLNEKSESIYPSWLVHMFANFAINTIGFILFGMIG